MIYFNYWLEAIPNKRVLPYELLHIELIENMEVSFLSIAPITFHKNIKLPSSGAT